MTIVLSTIVIIGGAALAYFLWKTNSAKGDVKIEDFADTRLVDEFVQSAEIVARFYNKSTPPREQQVAMTAYRRILAINGELQRRKASLKLLEPFLHDDRDAVRVVTAMALSKRGDGRCIKILKDVAERPEVNTSNVVMLAQFFLTNIENQKDSSEGVSGAMTSGSTITIDLSPN
jgi:hypothetical protein